MTTPPPPTKSIREGEHLGMPSQAASAPHDKDPVIGHIKIGRVLDVPIHRDTADAALGKAMQACKSMYEHWKEAHPHAEKTPIRYKACSTPDAQTQSVPNHKPANLATNTPSH